MDKIWVIHLENFNIVSNKAELLEDVSETLVSNILQKASVALLKLQE